jgi:hypothetical protein
LEELLSQKKKLTIIINFTDVVGRRMREMKEGKPSNAEDYRKLASRGLPMLSLPPFRKLLTKCH